MGTGLEFVALAAAFAGTATSAMQARAQNAAAARSAKAAQKAADVKRDQLEKQAAVERKKQQNLSAQIRGRLAVSAAASGAGFGGSYDALMVQTDTDEAMNLGILEDNLASNRAMVDSGLEADLASISGHTSNTLLAAFNGGIQGLSAGLSIARGIKDMRAPGGTS